MVHEINALVAEAYMPNERRLRRNVGYDTASCGCVWWVLFPEIILRFHVVCRLHALALRRAHAAYGNL